MHHTLVKSSNLKSIYYDKETSTLEVRFNGSGEYHFFDVPEIVYQKFYNSASKGKFFAENVKNKYRFVKHK